MTVTVYARHSRKCPKSGEKGSGQYKQCKCPLWLRWGTDGKKSTKTRSWDIATRAARKLEQELELAANGIEPPKKADHITIETAVDLYLSDMAQHALAKPTIDGLGGCSLACGTTLTDGASSCSRMSRLGAARKNGWARFGRLASIRAGDKGHAPEHGSG
jgi:hypothetical protein